MREDGAILAPVVLPLGFEDDMTPGAAERVVAQVRCFDDSNHRAIRTLPLVLERHHVRCSVVGANGTGRMGTELEIDSFAILAVSPPN